MHHNWIRKNIWEFSNVFTRMSSNTFLESTLTSKIFVIDSNSFLFKKTKIILNSNNINEFRKKTGSLLVFLMFDAS